LRGIADEIREKGAELIAVGNGTAKQAKRFHEDQKMTFPLLTDPSLRTYRAAGFLKGLRTVANAKSAKHGVRAVLQGFVQGRTQGTADQQGGALVIAKNGTEIYRYVSQEAGDHPDPKDLVGALH
jgi:hypothetical protein